MRRARRERFWCQGPADTYRSDKQNPVLISSQLAHQYPVSYGDLVLTSRGLYNCSFQFYLGSGLELWLTGFSPSHCISTSLKAWCWDFDGGPVPKTLCSQCRGPEFDPRLDPWMLDPTNLN